VTVIIRADKQIRAGRVQEIIEKCQKAEFDTFALRGKQSEATATVE
jgi:biopolymer transport protein ExbD